jgi:hypothetical protein
MADEVYRIIYETDASRATPGIEQVKSGVIGVNEYANASIDALRKLGTEGTKSLASIGSLGKAFDGLKGGRSSLEGISSAADHLPASFGKSLASIKALGSALDSLKAKSIKLDVGDGFAKPLASLGRLSKALADLGSRKGLTEATGAFGPFVAAAEKSRKAVAALGTEIEALKGHKNAILDLRISLEAFHDGLVQGREGTAKLGAELDALKGNVKPIDALASAAWKFNNGAIAAEGNVSKLGTGLAGLGTRSKVVKDLATDVTSVQRHAYGARKSIEEMGTGLDALKAKSSALPALGKNLGSVGTQSTGLGKSLGTTTTRADGLLRSLEGFAARIAIFQQLKEAISGVGTAINDARKAADEGAKGNLTLRDQFRELANLQGKPTPDNEVVAGAMRFRLATGATNHEANDALRRFEGGLPTAVEKGNITGSSTTGVAGEMFRDIARLGTRQSLSGETSGLLASKIAQTEKIDKADKGTSSAATVIDLLNRGDGDLTPLVKSLVNTGGGLVGEKGSAFKDYPELAAAMRVTSLNATPPIAGTRVRQATTALNRFGDLAKTPKPAKAAPIQRNVVRWKTEKFFENGKVRSRRVPELAPAKNQAPKEPPKPVQPKAGDTLKALNIAPDDDFVTKIEKLAPAVEGSKNIDLALSDLGFDNQAERRALKQLIDNRALLRKETEAARKRVPASEAKQKNAAFFASDDAQNRIGVAQKEATAFAQFTKDEPVKIARDKGEASLRAKGDLDTAHSGIEDFMVDLAPTRLLGNLATRAAGKSPDPDMAPVFMGGKPARQVRIENEALGKLNIQANQMGFDPEKKFPELYGDVGRAGGQGREQQITAIAGEIQKRGGTPLGDTGQTDALLRQLIHEVQVGNGQRAKNGQPAFLPQNPIGGAKQLFPGP